MSMQKDISDDLYPQNWSKHIEKDHEPIMFTTEIARVGPNVNNRIYTKEMLEEIVRDFEKRTCVLGCLEPPERSLEKISHKVIKMKMVEDRLIAEVQILNTPCGKILAGLSSLWDAGSNKCRFGITGTGIVKNGVVTNYKLASVDLYEKE